MHILRELRRDCEVLSDRWVSNAFALLFRFDGTLVTIRIVLDDEQSGADLVITNMAVLPKQNHKRRWGSKALKKLLFHAGRCGLKNLQATEVSNEQSERFWKKNGFVEIGNKTGDFRYSPSR